MTYSEFQRTVIHSKTLIELHKTSEDLFIFLSSSIHCCQNEESFNLHDFKSELMFQVEQLATMKTLVDLQITYFSDSLSLLRKIQSSLQTQYVFF